MLTDGVIDENGVQQSFDGFNELTYLRGLRDSRARVPLEIGSFSATVRVEEVGIEAGGLGGGNGLDGWDSQMATPIGTWELRVVTLETV